MEAKTKTGLTKVFLSVAIAVLSMVLVYLLLSKFGNWGIPEGEVPTTADTMHKALCCGSFGALIGGLVYILAREGSRDIGVKRTERPVWFYPLMAGLLSLGAMCVSYTFLGMWPFGEKTTMMVDMHHQYAPLLAELRYDILHGEFTLYTFGAGPGANYLSMFGYYLASPFNLLLVVFPERLLAEGILCITLLKNALSGAMFALCVQQLHGKRGLHIPVVSVMYSLMMYLLAYSWNLMWLDVVMVLPLVIYGFERLMHTGKFLTYVLSLAYALYANYYIGFMVCVFLVLYYLAYVLRSKRNGKQLGLSFARFAGFSVLAAGLTAALLIPVYFALQSTSAAGAELPEITNTLDIWQLLGRHLADTSPTIRSGNLPNMYCGILTAVCIPLFALNKGIAPRRRATYMALWLVLFFSFLVNLSDLAWHGFHFPNDLPYRFSFVYSFFLLLIAGETLVHIKHIELRHVFATFAGGAAYIMLEEHFGDPAYEFSTVYFNLFLLALYTAILALSSRKMMRRTVTLAILLIAVTGEMVLGAGDTFLRLDQNEYMTRHEDYVDNDTTEAIRKAIAETKRIGDKQQGDDFYRMEFMPRRTCVDTALFQYRGITSFSSSNYYKTTTLLGGLGYAINGVNSHLYHSYNPFTDSLLGIRYVIVGGGEIAPEPLRYLSEVKVGDETYAIYENPYALGLGFVAHEDIKDYKFTPYDPFYSQNQLYNLLTDDYASVFTMYAIESNDQSLGTTVGTTSGFRTYTDEINNVAYFSVTVTDTAPILLYADCRAADYISISLGEQQWSCAPYEPYIVHAGTVEAGSVITLAVSSTSPCSGNFYVAELDDEVCQSGLASLAQNQLTVTEFYEDRIVGTVKSSGDGVLVTSIPYDEGWTVTVDGKPVKTFAISDGLLAFNVDSGNHDVELVYTPKGLWIGLAISGLSILVLIALLVWSHHKKQPTVKETLDFENVQPIQQGFSVTDAPVADLPPLPDTLQELTDHSDEPPLSE